MSRHERVRTRVRRSCQVGKAVVIGRIRTRLHILFCLLYPYTAYICFAKREIGPRRLKGWLLWLTTVQDIAVRGH